MIGGQITYTVVPGDFLGLIGARFGIDDRVIASDNGIEREAILRIGQVLKIDNRHIVPNARSDGLIVNIPQRMLFYLENGDVVTAFPIAAGRRDWQTPTGRFKIVVREKDKTWIVPPSIQDEMREEGKPVLTEVQPGPDNPLGRHWLGLSLPGIGIHGTIAPSSIYSLRSHGCIRSHPDDIAVLFELVKPGTPGEIIYVPLLLAERNGRVYLEVQRDAYKRGGASLEEVQSLARERGLFDKIDWPKAEEMVARREGVARDVTAASAMAATMQPNATTAQP